MSSLDRWCNEPSCDGTGSPDDDGMFIPVYTYCWAVVIAGGCVAALAVTSHMCCSTSSEWPGFMRRRIPLIVGLYLSGPGLILPHFLPLYLRTEVRNLPPFGAAVDFNLGAWSCQWFSYSTSEYLAPCPGWTRAFHATGGTATVAIVLAIAALVMACARRCGDVPVLVMSCASAVFTFAASVLAVVIMSARDFCGSGMKLTALGFSLHAGGIGLWCALLLQGLGIIVWLGLRHFAGPERVEDGDGAEGADGGGGHADDGQAGGGAAELQAVEGIVADGGADPHHHAAGAYVPAGVASVGGRSGAYVVPSPPPQVVDAIPVFVAQIRAAQVADDIVPSEVVVAAPAPRDPVSHAGHAAVAGSEAEAIPAVVTAPSAEQTVSSVVASQMPPPLDVAAAANGEAAGVTSSEGGALSDAAPAAPDDDHHQAEAAFTPPSTPAE